VLPFKPPRVVDLLTQAIEYVRAQLGSDVPIGIRTRRLWAGVVAAHDLGAADVVYDEFVRLAGETGLTAQLRGRDQDVEHVIRWGLRGWCPFDTARRRPANFDAVKAHIEHGLRDAEETASKLDPWTREQLRLGGLS